MENPKDLITAHLGADFDCLAAMVAAQKLYPEASLAFPGSQEGAVRAYLQSVKFSFPLLRVKQVDGRNLRRLIVVAAIGFDASGTRPSQQLFWL